MTVPTSSRTRFGGADDDAAGGLVEVGGREVAIDAGREVDVGVGADDCAETPSAQKTSTSGSSAPGQLGKCIAARM